MPKARVSKDERPGFLVARHGPSPFETPAYAGSSG